MLQKAFKVIGLVCLGVTMARFSIQAVNEIKEEQTEDTNHLDNIASFSRKIVKKGFEKDKNDVLLIKNKYNEMKAKDPQAAKEAIGWGLAAGGVYYIGLFIYKSNKRRNANV